MPRRKQGSIHPVFRCERCNHWEHRREGQAPPPCPNCRKLSHASKVLGIPLVASVRKVPTIRRGRLVG